MEGTQLTKKEIGMKTINEIAYELLVHRRTVKRWIQKGLLRAIKIDNTWRVTDEEYRRFLEEAQK